jgi:GNAT superfamily N-acetyltransferase
MARVLAPVDLRPYEDGDEEEVLRLLDAALGGGPAGSRPAEFFRWKHLDNPFGRSYLLVAEADGRIVGLRAFMRWRFVAGDITLRAVRAVDTATHPDFQGRGIFSLLTRRALEDLRDETDLIFNTPNDKSLPGYLKMGWRVVGRIPIYVRVRRPVHFVRYAWDSRNKEAVANVRRDIDATPAGLALDAPGLEDLLHAGERFAGISTDRSIEYLRWRYGDAPLLDYRAVSEPGHALAIFRVRPRGALVEATVSELITRRGDQASARRVLARVTRSSRADHVACSFPNGSTAMSAARRGGFIRVPGGLTLVANPLGHELVPDPLLRSAWAPSIGDLEVF